MEKPKIITTSYYKYKEVKDYLQEKYGYTKDDFSHFILTMENYWGNCGCLEDGGIYDITKEIVDEIKSSNQWLFDNPAEETYWEHAMQSLAGWGATGLENFYHHLFEEFAVDGEVTLQIWYADC